MCNQDDNDNGVFPKDVFPDDVFPEDVFPSNVFPREDSDDVVVSE